MTAFQSITLDDGEELFVEITPVNDTAETLVTGRAMEVGTDQVFGRIAKFAAKLKEIVEVTQPDEAQIEIGVGFSVESGQLTAVLMKGIGEGNVKVSLKWTKAKSNKA